MIFETMDSSQDGRISKKEFALCIVSDLDTTSGTTDTSPTSAYEALLITVLGIHTPSDSPYLKEDEECIFSTKCQFGKKPASTIDDSYSKMSGWHSHYSYPIHNRMSSSEETMDVTVSLVTRLGSRTRIGGYVKYHSQKKNNFKNSSLQTTYYRYATISVPLKTETGVTFEGWVRERYHSLF